MPVTIPLDRMTTADELRALEEIWRDLQRLGDQIPSPAWHADVLRAREQRVAEGSASFVDWETAKGRIRGKAG
jgi:hypothetical protein